MPANATSYWLVGVVEHMNRALAVAEPGDVSVVDRVVPGQDTDGSSSRCERMLSLQDRARALSAASGPEALMS